MAIESNAKEAVNDQPPSGMVGNLCQAFTTIRHIALINRLSIVGKPLGVQCSNDTDFISLVTKQARCFKRIAPIVTGACENQDGGCRSAVEVRCKFGGSHARFLHQTHRGKAGFQVTQGIASQKRCG